MWERRVSVWGGGHCWGGGGCLGHCPECLCLVGGSLSGELSVQGVSICLEGPVLGVSGVSVRWGVSVQGEVSVPSLKHDVANRLLPGHARSWAARFPRCPPPCFAPSTAAVDRPGWSSLASAVCRSYCNLNRTQITHQALTTSFYHK